MIPAYVFSGVFLGTLSAAAVFSGAGGWAALLLGYALFALAATTTLTVLWFLGPVLNLIRSDFDRPSRLARPRYRP
ncbi:MAG: hypothetical protein ACRBCL_08515 [Maritimibacter sp.]